MSKLHIEKPIEVGMKAVLGNTAQAENVKE